MGFLLDQSFTTGLAVVGKLCSTEVDLTSFLISTAGNASSANLGDVYGGAVGFGYTLILTVITNSGDGS